ncbi:hypothetical protein F5Y17DRAFT_177550 [Xylariaceae sp. FL0594]|nr:hypothetical protein F5Y17DRAFT_177550 [Xylariaceae sp. FL0594]
MIAVWISRPCGSRSVSRFARFLFILFVGCLTTSRSTLGQYMSTYLPGRNSQVVSIIAKYIHHVSPHSGRTRSRRMCITIVYLRFVSARIGQQTEMPSIFSNLRMEPMMSAEDDIIPDPGRAHGQAIPHMMSL